MKPIDILLTPVLAFIIFLLLSLFIYWIGGRMAPKLRKVGGKLNVLDISSTYCQQRKGVVVERLDHFDEEENAWLEICLEDRHVGPAEVAATRMDFAAWLKSLPKRLRRIAKFLATGETTTVAAKKFGVCPGRISQIRMELKRAWQTFQGEEPGTAVLAA